MGTLLWLKSRAERRLWYKCVRDGVLLGNGIYVALLIFS